MAGYQPLKITGNSTGLVKNREEFLLPNDAYPILENAYVWRERILRKQGCQLLGRLQRNLTVQALGSTDGSGAFSGDIFSALHSKGIITNITNAVLGQVTSPNHGLSNGNIITITDVVGMTQVNNVSFTITVVDLNNFTIGVNTTTYNPYVSGGTWYAFEQYSALLPGSVSITIGGQVFTDPAGNGVLTNGGTGTGTINYFTGALTLQTAPVLATTAITAAFSYFPGLPVMGLRSRIDLSRSTQPTIAFDTKYAYVYGGGAWTEWISGTTWHGSNSQFFWSTNYWTSALNAKLFWVTNFNLTDYIYYTDGNTWTPFTPVLNGTAGPPDTRVYLQQCLALLPFRGCMMAFNTVEGTNNTPPFVLGPTSTRCRQRVRWSKKAADPTIQATSWLDSVRGAGGYLDIPTAESITAVGFVRDNLVVYCERSTWQIRYNQSSVNPFVVERVNSELGTGSLNSAVQFDTSLVGIGDKGIVECDSYQSVRIDPQIPDLVFSFNQLNAGAVRISGVRDFIRKLAFWTYPSGTNTISGGIFPDYRLVYNYDNKSWAIFTDSYTCLGTFQPAGSRTWAQSHYTWASQHIPWTANQPQELDIVGGNQQGYIERLDQPGGDNDPSLSIVSVSSNAPVTIVVPNHNLEQGAVIEISDIPTGTGYDFLNGQVFAVVPLNTDPFNSLILQTYDPIAQEFVYYFHAETRPFVGYGRVSVRDNFSVVSKKFNFMDEGQNIQLGYIDVLMNETASGGIALNLYLDYNSSEAINTITQNQNPLTGDPDMFFNTIVPTTNPSGKPSGIEGNKLWYRIFCPVRGAFITAEWTLSNAQMFGIEQQSDVQIDAQILWMRKSGRLQTSNI
jgi:hypothetical protein